MQMTIQKLIFGGSALAEQDGQNYFIWGGLPGEEVEVLELKKRHGVRTGVVSRVIQASSARVEPRESHYLTCSPWQILDFGEENRWKGLIAAEQFSRLAKIELPNITVKHNDQQYHYRNKMEYSFWEDETGLHLAFFDRGTKRRSAIEPCVLARDQMNALARSVLSWLNEVKVTRQEVKSLIVRQAGDQAIAGLFVKDRVFCQEHQVPADLASSFVIYYSDPRSPMSRPDELLFGDSGSRLSEQINGYRLNYGLMSFFQINVPMFQQALADIGQFINHDEIVDLYCGVGAISIGLSERVASATLVESDAEAVKFAEMNITQNYLSNYTVVHAPAEKALDEIRKDRLLIIDPPRSGLHPKVIERILAVKPARIIYLSCDLATQARDIGLLSANYRLTFNQLYNFFPRTPHVESLVVLKFGS